MLDNHAFDLLFDTLLLIKDADKDLYKSLKKELEELKKIEKTEEVKLTKFMQARELEIENCARKCQNTDSFKAAKKLHMKYDPEHVKRNWQNTFTIDQFKEELKESLHLSN